MEILRWIDLEYETITLIDIVESVEHIRKRIFGNKYEIVSTEEIVKDPEKIIAHYTLTQGMLLDMTGLEKIDPSLYIASVNYNILIKRIFSEKWDEIKKIVHEFLCDTWWFFENEAFEEKYNEEFCFYYEENGKITGITFEEILQPIKNSIQ